MDGGGREDAGGGLHGRYQREGLHGGGTAGLHSGTEAAACEPHESVFVWGDFGMAGARRADRMGTGAGVAGSVPRFLGTRVLGIGDGQVRIEPGSASRFSTANRCAPSTFSLPFGRSETYISLGLGGFLGKTPTYGNPVAGSRWQDFARAGGGRNR